MKKTTLNKKLNISYPDSFTVLSETELADAPSWVRPSLGVKSTEEELTIYVVCAGSVKPALFTSFLMGMKLLGFEKNCRREIEQYKREKELTESVCGVTARGFEFSGSDPITDEPVYGEVVCFAFGGKIYIVQYIARTSDRFYCRQAFECTISSISPVEETNSSDR
ncbi:hypothetical protein [Ruminococcus sp.]|uniref:hypothetical protein n=1 Tax=Ruminococcus sp. TaxID=41978 RepID=UPI0025CBD0F4|nr:hypothetical protein [Ruminococcus sp.]MBQ8967439.1 hypothetical protein [Ruminococcus sp.]